MTHDTYLLQRTERGSWQVIHRRIGIWVAEFSCMADAEAWIATKVRDPHPACRWPSCAERRAS